MDISFTPWTSVSPNQTASTMSAWEDQFEDSLLITNIAASDFATGIYPTFNVFSYGAVGDGTSGADTTAFQAAIDAAEAAGGGVVEVPVPPSYYSINSTITITEGVMIRGVAPQAETTSNANGTDSGFPAIKWDGSGWDGSTAADVATTTMFWFKSGSASNYLFGGGMKDLVLYGDTNGASVAVRASSTVNQDFDRLRIRKMGLAGVLLDSANGVLQQGARVRIQYTWGSSTSANEAASDGVRIGGGDYPGGSHDALTAQNDIDASGLVYNGTLVALYGTDNNRIWRAHASVQAKTGLTGSSGFSIGFYDDPSGSPAATKSARNNVVYYAVAPYRAESLTYGNRILHINSEGATSALNFARDNVVESGAQLHIESVDYVHADVFTTLKYPMTGEWAIPAQDFKAIVASPSESLTASLVPSWAFDDGGVAANESVGVFVPSKYDWSNGTITKIRVYFNAPSAQSAFAWHMRLAVGAYARGASVATPAYDAETTVSLSGMATDNDTEVVEVTTSVDYSRGDMIYILVGRAGDDAADTATGDVNFLGVDVIFESDGPDNQTSTWTPNLPYST